MLEHVPAWIGSMLLGTRAGHERLVAADSGIAGKAVTFELESPAFGNGARLPVRCTADGEGVSPPLLWAKVPDGTASLALIVEDPDAPAAMPLVHAIVLGIGADERRLAEGAIGPDLTGRAAGDVGRNSYLQKGWLPPDPPTGHGEHDYVFQLFALSERPEIGRSLGRSEFVRVVSGRVLGIAILVGTYSRGEPTSSDLIGAATTPQSGLAAG